MVKLIVKKISVLILSFGIMVLLQGHVMLPGDLACIPDEYMIPVDDAKKFEEFYFSLPEFKLPVDNTYSYPDTMVEVPESLLDKLPTYGQPTWAVRLPEWKEPDVPEKGLKGTVTRYILVEYEQENGERVTVLCSFWDEYMDEPMKPKGYIVLSGIREIDGGRNVLATSFDIDEHYYVTVYCHYIGIGAGGQDVKVLFREELFANHGGSEFQWVGDQTRRITKYKEEGLYRFIVRSYLPYVNEKNKWDEKDEEIRYYFVNSDSQLIEVDELPPLEE